MKKTELFKKAKNVLEEEINTKKRKSIPEWLQFNDPDTQGILDIEEFKRLIQKSVFPVYKEGSFWYVDEDLRFDCKTGKIFTTLPDDTEFYPFSTIPKQHLAEVIKCCENKQQAVLANMRQAERKN